MIDKKYWFWLTDVIKFKVASCQSPISMIKLPERNFILKTKLTSHQVEFRARLLTV